MTEGDGAVTLPRRPWRLFSDDRAFWRMAAVLFGSISFAKGARAPSRWAATQALINYDHGLVKRGLFGATLGHWLSLERYERFTVVSYVLLATFFALLIAFAVRSGVGTGMGAWEPVALFFSSFAVTYLVSLVGYLDICLGILTLLLLLVRDARLRFALGLPLCVIAMLIHEMFLFVFLPAVLFSFVIDGMRTEDQRGRRMIWSFALILFVISAGVAVGLALKQPMSDAQVRSLSDEAAERADFPVRDDFFDVLTRSGAQNVRVVVDIYLHERHWDFLFALAAVVFAPVALLLSLMIAAHVRSNFQGVARRRLLVLAISAALSPLLMHMIGWDNARWDALVCLEEFLVLGILVRARPEFGLALNHGYRNATVLVMALSMITGESLMEFREPNWYPFTESVRSLAHTLHQRSWQPPAM
jgi:hypothetical protein